ncbi:MAG: aldo/keto reductase [Opitutaceae bacterium]
MSPPPITEDPTIVRSRALGCTGLEVSEIGFGTWGLGGDSYGPVEDAASLATLRFAYDSGVTFYDTSDLYGGGHSEKIVGEALRDVREHVMIATKVGLLPHSGFEMPSDFSPRHIRDALEASLRRLQTDYVDLYLLHSPTIETLRGDPAIMDTLRELQQSGKIRAFGASVRSPGDGMLAIREFDLPVIQVNFNLIDQRALTCGLFDLAKQRGTGIVIRTPLCFGYLTGKLNGNETLPGKDHRANWPVEQLRRWAGAPDLFSFINEGRSRTAVQLALRFCLDHPAVSTVIPGMMCEAEVRENLAAGSLAPLSTEEQERIQLVYANHEFYDKNAKNK